MSTQVTQQQILDTRRLLPSDINNLCDEDTIIRFIRATGGNLKLSAYRLEDTTKWRQKVKPETVACTTCMADPRAHYMHIVGHDKTQRPIIYSCLELAKDRNVQNNMDHMMQTFEQAIRLMPAGVEQWIWFSDLYGFGARDLSPGIGKTFATLAGTHYPERLGVFLLVDPPMIFKQLWNVMQAFIDPKTKTKLRVIPYDIDSKKSKLLAVMDELFGEEIKSWLLTEMKANRTKGIKKSKHYSYKDLVAYASSCIPCEDQTWQEHWGTASFKHHVKSYPSLLLPDIESSQQSSPKLQSVQQAETRDGNNSSDD